MDSKKALLGIVAGIAAGAVLGVLFAPEKGSRTRRGIARKGEDLADTLNDKIDEKFDELVDALAVKMKKAKSQSNGEHAKTEVAV